MDVIEEIESSVKRTPGNTTIILSRTLGHKYQKLLPSFLRGETPDTLLSVKEFYPDISVYCDLCNHYLFVVDLPKHRKYHKHLHGLGYRDEEIPTNVDQLLTRRRAIMARIQNSQDNKLLRRIPDVDYAFEFLRNYMFRASQDLRIPVKPAHINIEDISSKPLSCSLACCIGVGVASTQNSAWRKSMEDSCVYQDYFGNHSSKAYLAVFDGYNGSFASQVAADELHHAVLCDLARIDPLTSCTCTYNMIEEHSAANKEIHRPRTRHSERVEFHLASANIVEGILHSCEERLDEKAAAEAVRQTPRTNASSASVQDQDDLEIESYGTFGLKIANTFSKAYYYTDSLLKRGQDDYATVRWSGCSATTVVLQETLEDQLEEGGGETPVLADQLGSIHLANAGVCHAILLRNNLAYRITDEHSTATSEERQRVLALGGRLERGKHEVLLNGVMPVTRGLGSHGDPELKRCLVPQPHTTTVPIDPGCQALIVASGGLWSALTEAEVAGIVATELPANLTGPSSEQSVDELVRSAPFPQQRDDSSSSCSSLFHSVSSKREDSAPPRESPWQSMSADDADVDTDIYTSTQRSQIHRPGWGEQIAEEISRRLTQAALLAGSTENITVVTVLFPAALAPDWRTPVLPDTTPVPVESLIQGDAGEKQETLEMVADMDRVEDGMDEVKDESAEVLNEDLENPDEPKERSLK